MTKKTFINNELNHIFMGQGFKILCTHFFKVRNFIQNVVIVLFAVERVKQTKYGISHFFSLWKEKILTHKHTQKITHHIKKHHKKYLFGGAFSFLLIKFLFAFLATYNIGTYAQNQEIYTIGDRIITASYEQCDDGNTDSGDGCSDQGQIEEGFTCDGSPSICAPTTSIVTGLLDTLLENTDYGQNTEIASGQTPEQQIIEKFYGPQSIYTTQRNKKLCIPSDMKVERLLPGRNTLPEYLQGNTIYILSDGDYITDYMVKAQNGCTVIVGDGVQSNLYTFTTRGANIKITSGSNVIIDQIIFHSITDGIGGIHSGNNYGVFVDSPANTISNIKVRDPISFAVYMENFDNTTTAIERLNKDAVVSPDRTINIPVILPTQEDITTWGTTISRYGYVLSGGSWGGILPLDTRNTSKLLVPIDFSSDDNHVIISFLSGTIFSAQNGLNYTGIILGPKNVPFSEVKSAFSGEHVLDAFKILGNQGNILLQNISGTVQKSSVSVKLPTPTSFYGASVYYSTGGEDWVVLEKTKIINMSGDEYIHFNTKALGYFVVIAYAGDKDILTGNTENTQPISITGRVDTGALDTGIIILPKGNKSITGTISQTGVQIQKGDKTQGEKVLDKKSKKQLDKEKLNARGFRESNNGKMVGKHSINMDLLSGDISTPIVIQSNDTIGSLPIEVEFPEGIVIQTQSGGDFTGILKVPEVINQTTLDIKNQNIVSAMKAGVDDQSLFFQDLSGKDAYVTVKIPTPNIPVGKSVVVNYSNNHNERYHLTDTTITSIDGSNFAVFQTNHFTTFSIGVYSGDFTINNDDPSTASTGVVLNMNITGATHMRFGDTPGQRDTSPWIAYSSTYAWTLEPRAGLHTVYAAFSGQGEIALVEDNIVGSRNRDNDYFLDDYFWSNNPTSGAIKTALYGDGIGGTDKTAYTNHRSGVLCNPATMNLIYVASGVNTLTAAPAANTIYVLSGGNYTNTATITAGGNCIAIVGKNRAKLFHTVALTNGAIYATTRSNIIIDNLDIDAVSNGTGGTHYSTVYGIYLRNPGNGHTVNNVKVSNARTNGIYLNASPNNLLNNVQVYNGKTDGISTTTSSNGTRIQNSETFNNGRYGINIASARNTINNTQSYNNMSAGILITASAAINNVVNNSQTYNNALYGIQLSASTGTVLNNIASYGNTTDGLNMNGAVGNTKMNNIILFNNGRGYYTSNTTTQTGNIFYGEIKIFGNGNNTFDRTRLITGGLQYSGLGWSTGNFTNNGIVSCDMVTRPDGFLYHPIDTGCNFRGVDGSLGVDYHHSYQYGSGLYTQIPPVNYSGASVVIYDDKETYDTGASIAQINPVSSVGYFKFKNNTYFTDTTGVQLYLGYDKIGSQYTITGDFDSSPLTGTMTGYSKILNINLTTSNGTKYADITFTSGSDSRSFSSQIQYIGVISDQTIKKYFGYNSFYTDNREYNFCDPRNITVAVINPGINTIPTPVTNRIYILNSGNYTSTAAKALLECNVLAGSGGNVFHFTNITRSNATFTANDKNIVVDKINFNGRDTGTGGTHTANTSAIYSTLGSNLTINDVDVYNHIGGLYLLYHKNSLINNANIYNNFNGTTASYGIQINGGSNAVLNNTKIFNHYSAGIYILATSANISLNNILTFNSRQEGLYALHYSNFALNNIQAYNNATYGLRTSTQKDSLTNNAIVYNNTTAGFSLNGSNKYYGNNKSFLHGSNVIQGSTGGSEFGYLGWSTGTFVNTGIMGCDLVVNPKNSITSTYLQTGATCNFRTYNGSVSGYTSEYVYGSGVSTQVQPVYYKNQELVTNNIPYDAGLYIGESPLLSTKLIISSHTSGFLATGFNILLTGNVQQGSTPLSGKTIIISGSTINNDQTLSDTNGDRSITVTLLSFDNPFVVQTTNSEGRTIQKFITININNSVPIMSTGYISSGTTGNNGSTIYYKGIINIRSDISDEGAGISGSTCAYSTSGLWYPAIYSGMGRYCEATGLNYTSNLDINFRIANQYGTYSTGGTGTYIYDISAPTGLLFTINNDASTTTTGNVFLDITCPSDAGVNGIEIAYGTGAIPINWTGCATTKTLTISTGDGIKTVYMAARDVFANTTNDVTDTIIYDTTGPIPPQLVVPTSGQTLNTGTVQFIWSTGTDAGVGMSGYVWQLSTDSFTSVYLSGTTNSTGVNISSIAQNTYQWRVASIDSLNQTGGWSSSQNFIIDLTKPTASIEYNTNTNLDVIATLTGFSETGITITNNAGSGIYIFTGNGTFIFEFADTAGNTGIATATVTWMKKLSFTGSTPTDNLWTSGTNFTGEMSITESNLSKFYRGRDAITYNFYDSGLLAMYNFDNVTTLGENTTTIKDASQYANDSVLFSGTTWTGNGKWGGAYKFNGITDYIATKLPTTTITNVSVESRVNITLPNKGTFRHMGSSSGGYSLGMGGTDHDFIGNQLIGLFCNKRWIPTSFTLSAGWHHFVMVLDGTSTPSFYVDGIIVPGSFAGVAPSAPAGDMIIGRNLGDEPQGPRLYSGVIDEVRVYNRVLSSGEIQKHYVSNLNKSDTDKRFFTTSLTGLLDGSYEYTGYAENLMTNNYTTGRTLNVDTIAPTIPILISPTNGQTISTGTVNLLRNAATDVGGTSGYIWQISTGSSFTVILNSGLVQTTGITIPGLNNTTYYRRVYAYDKVGNIGERSSGWNFIINTTPPTIATAIVYSGTTGYNNPNYYYKGIIDIRSSVSDVNGISGSTCEYTTGGLRVAAIYSGTSTTGYCYKTGLNYTTNLTINFRVKNISNMLGNGTSTTYNYDNTAPTGLAFKINNDATGTNTTGVTLNITCPTDAGVNGIEIAYGNTANPSNRTSCSTTKPRTITTGDGTKTVYMATRDAFQNTSGDVTDTIIYDTTGPTIPQLISPTSGQILITGNIQLTRSGSIDAGVGLNGYLRQLSTGSNFTNVYLSGSTLNTGININGLSNTTYYRRVYAYDQLNTTGGRSTGSNFVVQLDNIPPTIIFTGSTPVSGSTILKNNFIPQIAIDEPSDMLGSFSYSSNGSNYTIYDSGVVVMYNFDNISALGENTSLVKDISQHRKTATVNAADFTGNGVWNGAYDFDGIANKYIQIGSTGIDLGTTHTISVWINPRSTTGVIIGGSTNVYGVSISGNKVLYAPANGNSISFDTIISLNRWTQLSIVRNGSNVSLYKNGSFVTTQTLSANDPLTIKYIGKENNDGSNEKRFAGTIDELYIYNHILSSGDISQLSRSSLSKYDIGKWLYTTNYQCIASGTTYIYSGSATDLADNQSQIIRSSTIVIPSSQIDVAAAASLDMGNVQSLTTGQTITGSFTGYFKVNDRLGTTGWYTTITLPTNLVGNHGYTISGSNIFFKASSINILSGLSTESIYVAGNFSGYVSPSMATTYIKRDISNIPFMCQGGVYGNNPLVRVDVPAFQAVDMYSGTIIYDIIY